MFIGSAANKAIGAPLAGGNVSATYSPSPSQIQLNIITGSITNTHINANAAIVYSKLAALTASKALVSDGSGFVAVSAVSATELGYVQGVTSSIQAQINAIVLDSTFDALTVGNMYLDSIGITSLAQPMTISTDSGADLYLHAGGTGAVKIGSSGDSIGFFGVTPSSQYNGGATGIAVAGTGSPVLGDSRFDGELGGSNYTINDIVRCLIEKGLMATV